MPHTGSIEIMVVMYRLLRLARANAAASSNVLLLVSYAAASPLWV